MAVPILWVFSHTVWKSQNFRIYSHKSRIITNLKKKKTAEIFGVPKNGTAEDRSLKHIESGLSLENQKEWDTSIMCPIL